MEKTQQEKEYETYLKVKEMRPFFADKKIELIVKWALIFLATGIAGRILTTYVINVGI